MFHAHAALRAGRPIMPRTARATAYPATFRSFEGSKGDVSSAMLAWAHDCHAVPRLCTDSVRDAGACHARDVPSRSFGGDGVDERQVGRRRMPSTALQRDRLRISRGGSDSAECRCAGRQYLGVVQRPGHGQSQAPHWLPSVGRRQHRTPGARRSETRWHGALRSRDYVAVRLPSTPRQRPDLPRWVTRASRAHEHGESLAG